VRMGQIAVALAERLGALDPANAETFRANAQDFRTQVQKHVAQWTRRAEEAPGAVLFHKDADYLMERLQVPVLGYLEPVAGVPPTPAHLHRLVGELKGKAGVILHTTYQPTPGPRFLERELGWESRQLPNSVPEGGGAEAYFEMIESWVEALGGAER
jgi:zinc/manganese transport system substrate-binding protein